MCGRYTITAPLEAIQRIFRVSDRPNLAPRYNVAPTQSVPIVRRPPGEDGEARQLVTVRWGLIPFWAKDESIGNRLINARADGVADKPAFRDSFAKRRCLVVADGFYEWQKQGSKKQPFRITLSSGEPFGFAGLWSDWKNPEGERVETCTIITTDANDLLEPIHNRMPVILDPADFDRWLDGDRDEALGLLQPYDPEAMTAYPVDPKVGNVRNESPDLIDPLPQQQQLL